VRAVQTAVRVCVCARNNMATITPQVQGRPIRNVSPASTYTFIHKPPPSARPFRFQNGSRKKLPRARARRRAAFTPTVAQIVGDKLTKLANEYWATTSKELKSFNPKLIQDVYKQELSAFDESRAMLLEFSCYLEK